MSQDSSSPASTHLAAAEHSADPSPAAALDAEQVPALSTREIGGRGGLDPTRYGDWEKAGRCIDF